MDKKTEVIKGIVVKNRWVIDPRDTTAAWSISIEVAENKRWGTILKKNERNKYIIDFFKEVEKGAYIELEIIAREGKKVPIEPVRMYCRNKCGELRFGD